MLKQFGKDRWAIYAEVARKFDLPPERGERLVARDIERVQAIIDNGLDIGGIAKYIIGVSLANHPVHGWVFVRNGGARDGEMFRVSDHIRG